jgi:hypothetical protein
MAMISTDYALWAKGLAARLRVLQASFSDDNPQTRQSFITEEIDRAVKQVPADKRKEWLEALMNEFPSWQSASAPAAAPAGSSAPLSPQELLAQLIDAAKSLPDATRAEFAEKLAAAGFGPKTQALPAFDFPPELQKALGFEPGETLTPERAGRIFPSLADLVLAVDRWVWALWKELAGQKSSIRKEADLGKTLGQYLKGDTEVSTQQVIQLLDRARKLNAGLLFGIGRAGAAHAARHLDQFSPEAILDLAKLERGFAAVEVKAWRKYVELANENATQQAIEKGIQDAIIKAAEDLINRGRAGL